jgi:hypothetical protein
MEGCLVQTVRQLKRLEAGQIGQVLRSESKSQEVTKSLLNLLFNICLTKAVPLSHRLKAEFSKHSRLVIQLLKGANPRANHTADIQTKKRLLLRNPELVRLISEACPARPAE